MGNNKSYRIKTSINNDSVLNIKLDQNYDFLEILSIKLNQTNAYKLHTSKYGVIVGRVLGNGNFGIPNAKVSVFIQVDDMDINDPIISAIYPYNTTKSKDSNNIRYNLLPNNKVNDCHQIIGTFPNKRLILDNDSTLEVYDKYYKFTTRTNESGDYMIFGVPVGNQTVHVDLDLSDIGILSQKPRDLVYKGYNITQFENPNQFKKDDNLDSLTQVYSQDSTVYVYPFWGDESEGTIAISRNDVQIQYKFEPTCVFMGCIVSDNNSNGVGKKCIATNQMGAMDELVTGNGTIEMIRKKPDDSVEEIQIQGTQLINGDGVWCYQIPMNLDYMMTDEYGNMVPTDDPEKGIPTRTRVRFRVSMQDFDSANNNNFKAKVLVPNNPKTKDDLDYNFGSATFDDKYATKSYRDLFWNNVYTVKSFIPRIQKGNNNRNERFTGIKHCNIYGNNNPIPYNNIRLRLPFIFVIVCAIIKCYIWIVGAINWLNMRIHVSIPAQCKGDRKKCTYLGDGLCPDLEGWYFTPNCWEKAMQNTLNHILSEENNNVDPNSTDYQNNEPSPVCVTRTMNYFIQCVEINLAQEYKIINFDFYNDWINGLIYIPRWIRNIRKKRSYLFGLITIKPKIQSCMESSFHNTRKYIQQCSIWYKKNENGYYSEISDNQKIGCTSNESKQKCHKGSGRGYILIFGSNGGVVHEAKTLKNQSVYYFKPCEWKNVNGEEVRCTLFATDIVLLGSLNDCDLNGIPKAFEELQSSTYQMPTNLALTNMDSEGYMYGIAANGKGGSVCNNKVFSDSGIVLVDDNLETYRSWSKDQPMGDQYDTEPEDDTTAITEAAGIDWGYNGPGQGNKDLSYLYLPGGHFLGVSCTNSEVNIKSCVNLSRICEQGVWMSQRQEIPRQFDKNSQEFTYLAITPTGLISKDEISDTNFRSMFASMNLNNLETEINPETSYLKYKFTYLRPLNFNGELEKYIRKSQGENKYYFATDVKPTNGADDEQGDYAIRRAIETVSNDYYRFRFGIRNDNDNPKLHYLKQKDDDTVSLPVYENSFYFYFGLHDGSTALDEFKKQFYSACPSDNEYIGDLSIQTYNASLCESSSTAIVRLSDLKLPCRFSMFLNNENVDVLDYQGCKKYLDGYYLRNASNQDFNIYIGANNTVGYNKLYVTSIDGNDDKYTEEYQGENNRIIYTKQDETNWYVGNIFVRTRLVYSDGTEEDSTFIPAILTHTEDGVDMAYRVYDWSKVQNYKISVNDEETSISKVTPNLNDFNKMTLSIGYNLFYTHAYGDSYQYLGEEIKLRSLPIGTHTFVLIDSDGKQINREFTVNRNTFQYTITNSDFTIDPSDETAIDILNKSKNSDNGYGYLSFNGNLYDGDIAINVFEYNAYNAVLYIFSNGYYVTSQKLSVDASEGTLTKNDYDSILEKNHKIKVSDYTYLGYDVQKTNKGGIAIWGSNAYYETYIVYTCPSDMLTLLSSKIGDYLVSGPSKLKLFITNLNYETDLVKYISEISENKSNWWEYLRDDINSWKLKNLLFYENKASSGAFSFEGMYYSGGTSPIKMITYGQSETSDDYGNMVLGPNKLTNSDEIEDGYSLSLFDVGIPTWNYKLDNIQRLNFGVKIEDSIGAIVPNNKNYFEFPAMYRPFYVNAVIWDNGVDNNAKLFGKLYNGITYNNSFGSNSKIILGKKTYNLSINNIGISDLYIDESNTDYNTNGRCIDLNNENYLIDSQDSESDDIYSLYIENGHPNDEELTNDIKQYGELDIENNAISESINAQFYDEFKINSESTDNKVILDSYGNSSGTITYYLINANGTPYNYPYDNSNKLINDAFIFREDITNDNIISDSNNNTFKLTFINNKAEINTSFDMFYIVGMSENISYEDSLNTFTVCKLYKVMERGSYNFTLSIKLYDNKDLEVTYEFLDEMTKNKFANKLLTISIYIESTTIKFSSLNSSEYINGMNLVVKKSLSNYEYDIVKNAKDNDILANVVSKLSLAFYSETFNNELLIE